nr:cohesin domain-containing protein [Cohnella sp. AR92]
MKPGSGFTAEISLNNLQQSVHAQDIVLTYDKDAFDYVSATGASDAIQIVAEDKAEAGTVRLLVAHLGGVSGPSTPVLKLAFKAKSGIRDTAGTIAVSQDLLGVAPAGTVIRAAASSKSILIGNNDAVVDKAALAAALAEAQRLYDAAVVGTTAGQYPQAAKNALGDAIQAAKAVHDNSGSTQAQVDGAVTALLGAIDTFKASAIKESSSDLNQDGKTDVGDLAIVAYYYGKTNADADWPAAKLADVNGDNKIDIGDLAYVARRIIQ